MTSLGKQKAVDVKYYLVILSDKSGNKFFLVKYFLSTMRRNDELLTSHCFFFSKFIVFTSTLAVEYPLNKQCRTQVSCQNLIVNQFDYSPIKSLHLTGSSV